MLGILALGQCAPAPHVPPCYEVTNDDDDKEAFIRAHMLDEHDRKFGVKSAIVFVRIRVRQTGAPVETSYSDNGDAGLASGDLLLIVFSEFNNAVRDRRVQVVVLSDVFLHYTSQWLCVDNKTRRVYNHDTLAKSDISRFV